MQKRLVERSLRALSAPHVRIDVASDGQEACALVHGMSLQGRSYLFITMDLSMPILDGLLATEIIRLHMYHGSSTPILAISSFDPCQPPLSKRSPGDFVFSEKIQKPLTFNCAHEIVSRFVPGAVLNEGPTTLPPWGPPSGFRDPQFSGLSREERRSAPEHGVSSLSLGGADVGNSSGPDLLPEPAREKKRGRSPVLKASPVVDF
eukprot:CAMPEP_0172612118 /NCGR_PEP_ID=MMETSP1068-20121228/31727_1 /TAXON_ID=35684 /ORGANISM="Pseudopedinella elastica, Strain CCMP716" /LENGTH=204 /DNA_ID=CAMNT_0013416263 /DNA_START=126 /DNA_END=740 /DNA_ORIENTATION=-